MDYPRDEIQKKAIDAIAKHGGPKTAKVFFKFTCAHCGQRCTFDQPNSLFERGECFGCGKETIVEKAGFMLQLGA